MDNRRNDYRYVFAPDEQVRVELHALDQRSPVLGTCINLSVGGMLVELKDPAKAPLLNDHVTARAVFPGADLRLALAAAVLNAHAQDGRHYLCLHFLPSANATADQNRENHIWRFLLDAQRKLLKRERQRMGPLDQGGRANPYGTLPA